MRDVTARNKTEAALIKSTEDLGLLYEASRQLNQSLEPVRIYETAYRLASTMLGCDWFMIMLRDHPDEPMVCSLGWRDGKPLDPREFPEPLYNDHHVLNRLIHGGESIRLGSYESPDGELRSTLIAPLHHDGQLVGMVQATRRRVYQGSDLQTFDALSRLIAAAVANATRYQQTEADLAERKAAEAALRRSEAQNQALLNAIPDLMFQLSREGRFLNFKAPRLELLVLPPDQFLGRTMPEVLPELASITLEKARLALDTGTVQTLNYQLSIGDSLLDFEARIVAAGDEEVLMIVRDMTDRVHAEQKLHASEQMLRLVMDNVPEAIFWKDRKSVFLGGNRAFVQDAGLESPEQIIGKTDFDLVWKDFADRYRADDHEVLDTGIPKLDYEEQQLTSDGDIIWLRTSKVPLYNNQGEIVAVLGMYDDITERKRTEAALHRRDAILEGMGYAGEQLLRAGNIQDVLPDVLARLGQAAGVSRVHIFENYLDSDGEMRMSQRNEWRAGDAEPTFDRPNLRYVAGGFGRWLSAFEDGHAIYGLVRDFPESERTILEPQKILSTAVVPIFSGGGLWGFLGFDDSLEPREWSLLEIETLRSVAGALGAALDHERTEAAAREQRLLAEALRNTAEAVNSTLRLDEVLERILDGLQGVIPHDAASIMLVEGSRLRIAGSRGYRERPEGGDISKIELAHEPRSCQEQIIQTGESLIINDTQQSPDWEDIPETRWVRAHIGAPIRREGQVTGLLNLDSAVPGIYTSKDAGWLVAFADQAAMAIGNAQLFAAEQEQRTLSDALRDTAELLSSTLDLDEVLERILTNIGRVVPHVAANIMLLEGGIGRVARYRGYEVFGINEWMQSIRVPLSSWPGLSRAILNGIPDVVFDTRQDEGWVNYPETEWILSHISAPIRIDGQVIGMLNLDGDKPNMFSLKDAERLLAFADQAAIAIENARLYDALSSYADELAALYRGTTFLFISLPMTSNLPEVGAKIAEAVVKEFGKVDCGVMVVDRATGEIVRLGRAGEYQVQASTPLHIDGAGLVPAAVRLGQLIYASDVSQDERYVPSNSRTRSELVVPLLTANGTIGVLDLQSSELNAFTGRDRRILSAFADRVAAAIENRQLYAEIHRYTDELEQRVVERTIDLSVRNAVAGTLSSSLDMDEMLNGVLQTTVEQLNVMGGAIYLLSTDGTALNMVAHFGVTEDALNLVTGIAPLNSDLQLGWSADGEGPTKDLTQLTGISAVISVPIWHQEQVQGIITLVHGQPRPWRSDETRMLDAIGRQIGVALANVRLYGEAVRGEAHIRTILQSVADGLLVFDHSANLVLMNPAAEALFSFYPAEKGGPQLAAFQLWKWLQALNPALDPINEFALPTESLINESGTNFASQCGLQKCIGADRDDMAWPCWLARRGPSDMMVRQCGVYARIPRRSIQARSAEVRDADGYTLGTVIVLHDVTYYRELDELKGRFVSTVSHELRTPLSAIMLQVSTLLKYYDRFEESERREMLGEIQQQAQVLRELIEDILELSRFDAKRATPQKRWFDLLEHCRGIMAELRPVVEEKQLLIRLNSEAGHCEVYGDPNQLMRAFRNLFSNALKYTPEGGKVSVDLLEANGEMQIVVQDTGIGIPPEEQIYVFDRFYRAENASRIASGTGLGLAITKEILDLHDGHIDLISVPGQGSTFTMCLPLIDRGNTMELPQPGLIS